MATGGNSGLTNAAPSNGTNADTGNQTEDDGSKEGSTNGGKRKGGADRGKGARQAPNLTNTGDRNDPIGDSATFAKRAEVVQRACDLQHNVCVDAVNSGAMGGTDIADCDSQFSTCVSELSNQS